MEPTARHLVGDGLSINRRGPLYLTVGWVVLCVISIALVGGPVSSAIPLLFKNDTVAHIPLIPAASSYLSREQIILLHDSIQWGTGR